MPETRAGVDTPKGVDVLGRDGTIPLDMASDAAGKQKPQPEPQISPIEDKPVEKDEIRLIKLLTVTGTNPSPASWSTTTLRHALQAPYVALSYLGTHGTT
jgi:hypothetical protein